MIGRSGERCSRISVLAARHDDEDDDDDIYIIDDRVVMDTVIGNGHRNTSS